MQGVQLPPFRLIHAAFVTHDLEHGKRRLAAMFGVKEFAVYPHVDVEVPGGAASIGFALATSHGMPLEVIQPTGGKDHVYRQLLSRDPADIAFHHFASTVESEAEWQLIMAARDQGLDMPVEGGSDEFGTRYAYLDTRAHLGHMLEFIWTFRQPDQTPDIEVRHERID